MDYRFGILLKQRKFCEIGYLYFQLQIGTGPVIGVWWYLVNCELRGLRFVTLGDPPGGCLELNFIRVFVDILQRLYSVNFASQKNISIHCEVAENAFFMPLS